MEKRGLLEARWSTTDTGREAKFYRLTEAGETELGSALANWERYAAAMASVLAPGRSG